MPRSIDNDGSFSLSAATYSNMLSNVITANAVVSNTANIGNATIALLNSTTAFVRDISVTNSIAAPGDLTVGGNLYSAASGIRVDTTSILNLGRDAGNSLASRAISIGRFAGNNRNAINSVCIGDTTTAGATNSIVIGAFARGVGEDQIAIGTSAGGAQSRNISIGTSSGNVAVGADATTIGHRSGLGAGAGSVFVGSTTGSAAATGDHNMVLGFNTGTSLTSGANNVVIGAHTTGSSSMSNSILIGAGIVPAVADGKQVVYISSPGVGNVIRANLTHIFVGEPLDNTSISGDVTIVGGNVFAPNVGLYLDTSANARISIGQSSGNVGAQRTVTIGVGAGSSYPSTNGVTIGHLANVVAHNCTVVGAYARAAFGDQVSFGFGAGGQNSRVSAFGTGAGNVSTGTDGVVVGYFAGRGVGTGSIYVGSSSGGSGATGSHNIAIGMNAGTSLTTGANNIVIGSFVAGSSSMSNSIIIGAGLTPLAADGKQVVYIGGAGVGNVIRANLTQMVLGERPGDNIIVNGRFSIGTAAPTANLHVEGNVYANGTMYSTGDITAFSDRSLKSNLIQVKDALDKMDILTGYTFDRIDYPGRRHAGVIAQDVYEVLPEAVHTGLPGGLMSVSHGSMSALFVEAIKELRKRVSDLETLVEDLKNKI